MLKIIFSMLISRDILPFFKLLGITLYVRKNGNTELLDANLHINTGATLRYSIIFFRMYSKYFILFVNILPEVPGRTLKG